MSATSWEAFLKEHLPAYLLPASMHEKLPVDVAQRFLERLTGRPSQLRLLRLASLFAPRIEQLRGFALDWLPALVRVMPSRTVDERRIWEGGFRGRIDVRATLTCRLSGRPTTYVTRERHRRFDLPENLLVRRVAQQLLDALVDLRMAGFLTTARWAAGAETCEGALRRLVTGTVLREVPFERATTHDRRAARSARHPCYHVAAEWDTWLHDALESNDPKRIAQLVGEGALTPLDAEQRFELAVAIKLVKDIAEHLEGSGETWTHERSIVAPSGKRPPIATFTRADGARVDVHFDQAALPAGPRAEGVRHYLGAPGRLRPDATVVVRTGSGEKWAFLVEVKHSSDSTYLARGYSEAMLYAHEHSETARRWPAAALVVSGAAAGDLRITDHVIALPWTRWCPDQVLESILSLPESG